MCKCMNYGLALAVGVGVGVAVGVGVRGQARVEAAEAVAAPAGPIGHMVYFSLNDASDAAKAKLVADCKKYLTAHAGELYFAAGVESKDLVGPFNDHDWDVALHIVFKDKASLDQYIEAPRHKEFVDTHKAEWKKVRVFDSVLRETMVTK
jgi:Stress responsive A/B Barrel Domain